MKIGSISINRPVLTSVLSILIVLFGAHHSLACDCGPKPSVRSAVENSQLVIHAAIIRAELKKALREDKTLSDSVSTLTQRRSFGPRYVNEYTVVVIEGFKGAMVNDTIIIRTGLDPVTDCGLVLRTGSELNIYGRSVFVDHRFLGLGDETADAYTTSVCSRTGSFSRREAKAIRKAVLATENVYYRNAY